jgi:head-tail adaptor
MGAGKYRETAAFERQQDAGGLDTYGNPAGAAWAALTKVRGNLRETTGKERIAAGRLEAPATGTLRVRASAATRAITAADRVTIRGNIWKLMGPPVGVDDRGRELEFSLERGGAVQ